MDIRHNCLCQQTDPIQLILADWIQSLIYLQHKIVVSFKFVIIPFEWLDIVSSYFFGSYFIRFRLIFAFLSYSSLTQQQ